jgi:hypothetical protein
MTAGEIAAGLAAQPYDVCAYLFPAGRRNGDEFEVGDVHGSPGRSLKVNLNGKAGAWSDFATGEKGDLLDLWRLARGLDTAGAMREAAEYLGSPPRRPDRHETEASTDVPTNAPAGHPKWKSKPTGRWCYRDADGKPHLIVYRYDLNDGAKTFSQFDCKVGKWIEKGGHQLPEQRPLYRLERFARRPATEIVLVEGEKCVDALAKLGILATTTLGGAGQIAKADFRPLAGRRVLVWRDADGAGRKYAETAAAKLYAAGAAEVLLVPLPEGKTDGWDVADAVREGWTAEEIRTQLDAAEPVERSDEAEQKADTEDATVPKYRFVGLRHALELPPIKFRIANILTEGGSSVLAGPSGHGKSFLALDLSLCVATGEPFRWDLSVKRGLVAYIAAEAFSGHGQRVNARLDYYGIKADPDSIPLHFLPAAPQLMEEGEVQSVLVAIEELPEKPALIVIDTLSMTFIGGDEKDGHDVGRYVGGIQRLQRVTGAHVMTLHHTGWNQERERGHTALRAAVDTMILLNREDNLVTMSCLKQRDAEPFADLHFELKSWGNSAVLMPLVGRQRPCPHPLPQTRQRALDALRAAGEEGGISFTKWCETTGLPKATFNRVKDDLVSWGLVEKKGGKWAAV